MNGHEKNPPKDLLWMFRYDAKGPRLQEVEFDPDDPIYHLYRHTRNPFLERAIAPSARKLKRSPEDLGHLFRFIHAYQGYRLANRNEEDPYERRTLEHPPPPPTNQPDYKTPETFSGDLTRLPWMIDVFFGAILSRLRDHPEQFKTAVEELMEQFQEEKVRIKIYQSYRSFRKWDDLMNTLEEIARYPSPETFDLFCSALFAYYDLAYPSARS